MDNDLSESAEEDEEDIVPIVEPEKYIYEEYGFTPEQWNSVAIMNELLSITQEIRKFKDSRLFLEEEYNKLLYNYKQSRIGADTLQHSLDMLDALEEYKMLNEKRARLEYLCEQNRAKALKQSMPNPMSLIATAQTDNLVKTASSLLFMAVDSKNGYDNYIDSLELQYLRNEWELDD